MSVTSGFFDYKLDGTGSPDRSYNSEELSRIFDGIITPGVFMHVGNALAVQTNDGMSVKVRSGRAWFEGKWINNDADIPLSVNPTGSNERWDTVVIDLDLRPDAATGRWAEIKLVQGPNQSSPAITPPLDEVLHKQYVLAVLKIPARTNTVITGEYIKTNVGASAGVTGLSQINWIGTPLTGFSADYYYTHWQSEFDNWFGNAPLNNGIKQTWNTWFTNTQNSWTTWFENISTAWADWYFNTQQAWSTWFNAAKDAWTEWFEGVQSTWTTWYAAKIQEFAALLSDKEDEFEVWMDTMHGKLDEETATHLQQQIDMYGGRIDWTIAVSDWTENPTDHSYSVTKEARYYTADSEPILWPDIPDDASITEKLRIRRDFAKIVSADTGKDSGAVSGKITFVAYKQLDGAITIHGQGGFYGRSDT